MVLHSASLGAVGWNINIGPEFWGSSRVRADCIYPRLLLGIGHWPMEMDRKKEKKLTTF